MLKAKDKWTDDSDVSRLAASSDDELIRRCRTGDESAWDQLVENYKRLIYSIPLNFGLTREDAADIFQQTLISLVENLDRLHPDSNLAAWLATVTRRHALHLLRKRKREQLGADEDLGESSEWLEAATGSAAEQIEQIQVINQGLNRIGPRCRALLLALYFDDRLPSYEEIAGRMNIPVGSIGPTRGRCLERLREVLSQE
ncbi:MAG TPA: sigma-70 family RNA polymerase sigma factor [Anaerolineales bacterium]|nr:sigma-70 family RNA polymerase sigma factor [Anaerolineales bacterium]